MITAEAPAGQGAIPSSEGSGARAFALSPRMAITVHHLNNSRSQRILWLLEELAVDYTIVRYARDKKTMLAPPEMKKIHPLGKSPIVEHDGRVLIETGAVVEYLLDTFDKGTLRPQPGTDAFLRHRFFLHYAEGSVMPPLLLKLITSELKGKKVPALVRPIAKGIAASVDKAFTDAQITTHLGFLDGELASRDYFVDTLSGADVMLSFPIEAAKARVGLDKYPRLDAWLGRIRARAPFQRALEKGGPYTLG
jgi:glutathione S-transferase